MAKKKEKKRIRVKDILVDIRSGMSEFDLMTKYGLSSRGLQSTFRKLVAAKAIRYDEICDRSASYEDTCEIIDDRKLARDYVIFELPVLDVQDSGNRGWVRDLTEEGLNIGGIRTSEGSVMKLLIAPQELEDFLPFTLEARCQWVSDDDDRATRRAGFQITKISQQSLEQLRKLIDFLTIRF